MYNPNSKQSDHSCTWAGAAAGYRTERGVITDATMGGEVEYSQIIVAENQGGIHLAYNRISYLN